MAMALMMAALGAKAQVTTNVRVGCGVITDNIGMTGLFQVNFPFLTGGAFTFSPSLEMDWAFGPSDWDEDITSRNLSLPLQLGYKVPIRGNLMFFPKVGPAVGYEFGDDVKDNFNIGPSVELAFENKHFVGAIRGYYSVKGVKDYFGDDYAPYSVTLNVGCKF